METGLICMISFFTGICLVYLIHKLLKQNKREPQEERMKELHLNPFMRKFYSIDNIDCNLCSLLFTESDCSLSRQHVQLALALLRRKQPMLRMRFDTKEGCDVDDVKYFKEIENDQGLIDFEEVDVSLSDWKNVFEDLLLENFDVFSNKSLWRVQILKEDFDPVTGVFKNGILFLFHHFICDGISITKLNDQFLEFLHQIKENNGENISVESYSLQPSLYQLAEKETQMSVTEKLFAFGDLITQWLEYKLVQYGLVAKPSSQFLQVFPPVILKEPTVPVKTCLFTKILAKEETQKLVEKCRRNNCTITGALGAATSVAFAKLLDTQEEYKIFIGTAVSLRSQHGVLVPADYLSCYVSALPFTDLKFSLKDGHLSPSFWDMAENYTKELKTRFKERAYNNHLKTSFEKFAKKINQQQVQESEGVMYNCGADFYLSNRGRHDIDPQGVRVYRFGGTFWATPCHFEGPPFRHFVMSANGQLIWCLTYASHITREETARKYLDEIFDILQCC